MEYMIEFDGVNGCGTEWWDYDDYDEMIAEIQDELRKMGGGHADIFDEWDNFVDDVEV